MRKNSKENCSPVEYDSGCPRYHTAASRTKVSENGSGGPAEFASASRKVNETMIVVKSAFTVWYLLDSPEQVPVYRVSGTKDPR